jgi:hypothetical protein
MRAVRLYKIRLIQISENPFDEFEITPKRGAGRMFFMQKNRPALRMKI